MAASIRSKRLGSRSRSRASASGKSRRRHCASCVIHRARASCARSWTACTTDLEPHITLNKAQLRLCPSFWVYHGDTEKGTAERSEEHTSELQSQFHLVCRLLLEKKKNNHNHMNI